MGETKAKDLEDDEDKKCEDGIKNLHGSDHADMDAQAGKKLEKKVTKRVIHQVMGMKRLAEFAGINSLGNKKSGQDAVAVVTSR